MNGYQSETVDSEVEEYKGGDWEQEPETKEVTKITKSRISEVMRKRTRKRNSSFN